jgi:O-antigen ligase
MMSLIFFYFFLFVFWAENVLGFKLSPITGLSFMNAAIYLLFLGWILAILQTRKLIEPNRVNKYIIILFTVFLISVPLKFLHAEVPNLSIFNEIVSLKSMIDPFLLFFLLYNCLGDEKYCRLAIAGLLVFLVVSVISSIGVSAGIITMFGKLRDIKGRTAGFAEPNQFAAYLVLFIPLLISGTLFSKNSMSKILHIGILLLSLIALMITGSRGGLISLILAMLIYFFLFFRRGTIRFSKLLPILFIGIPLLIGSAFMVSPDHVQEVVVERFDPTKTSDTQQLTSGRNIIWANGLKLFLQSPIYGHGSATFIPLMKKNFGSRYNSHNDYLLYLVHYGIIGLALFLMILWSLIRESVIIARESEDVQLNILALSYLTGLSGYAVAMFGVNIIQPQFLFWAYSAAVLKYGHLHLNKHSMEEVSRR